MSAKRDSTYSICIAIPTYNRETVLCKTIEQVLQQDPPSDEVLVIDQTPEHEAETERYLKELRDSGRIRWIKHGPPNLPGARNRALRETGCVLILFIDDDVLLTPGFIGKHAVNFEDPKVVAVAGRTIQNKGWLKVRRPDKWPRCLDFKYFPLDSGVRADDVANFIGCNHSVRRESALRLGGYDENYIGRAYREDSDMAMRLWRSGGRIVYDPEPCLTHLAAPSGGCRLDSSKSKMPEWQVSFPGIYFITRHFFPRATYWHHVLFAGVRSYVMRRVNVMKPWRLPWAFLSYVYSCMLAGKLARSFNRSAQTLTSETTR